MKKLCSVYFRSDGAVVLASNFTTARFWITNGYGSWLVAPTPQELTAAVVAALDHSQEGVPVPHNEIAVPEWISERRIKTWKALEKGARSFWVQIYGSELILSYLEPYRTGGFVVDREETHPKEELGNIGARLLEEGNDD